MHPSQVERTAHEPQTDEGDRHPLSFLRPLALEQPWDFLVSAEPGTPQPPRDPGSPASRLHMLLFCKALPLSQAAQLAGPAGRTAHHSRAVPAFWQEAAHLCWVSAMAKWLCRSIPLVKSL